MAKIKLTKNELKKQKDSLKRFNRYLPTLKLKKQQLQVEIAKVQQQTVSLKQELQSYHEKVMEWVAVFGEDFCLNDILSVSGVKTSEGNVAGIDIPLFKEVVFAENEYDLLSTPFWVDAALAALKTAINLIAHLKVLNEQEIILQQELQVTVQRVNLFEKVKIPQGKENIRVINIFLGDLQTAEVVRGKLAKKKIEKKKELQTA
ncbi:MAG: V-type ATP synthase subunit D [Candidatus Omnitrophica bacterium]|nr:V-type ATP synthase subunit D [Candidatus Omnitrophota bacterium]